MMADVDALYADAERLKDSGDAEGAIAKLNELLAVDDSHVLSHLTLAVLLGKVGRHEQAVVHVQRACDLAPTEAFNFTAASVCYQRAFAGTGDRTYIQKAEDAMARAHMLQGG
jgi:tetratricopeptide (TPR) repeat protein